MSPPKKLTTAIAFLALALAAACGGSKQAPPAVPSVTLPSGNDLKPYDPAAPSLARPEGMALYNGIAYVTLGNYDATYAVRGPGLLAAVVPSTGATTVIDLGGSDGQRCKQAGFVRQGGNFLYVSCTGDYNDGSGTALVEVDPATNKVTRSVAVPTNPYGVAPTASKIWLGDSFGGNIYAVDKTSFTVIAGPVAFPCPAKPDPVPKDWFETTDDVLEIGGSLYAICSNQYAGTLSQLNPDTGAVKLQVDVGPDAVELAETGDGRIAVVSGADNGLRLVTVGASAMTVQTLFPFSSQTVALQDIRARDNFLFTAASGSNTVQKIDLNAKGGPAVIAEANVGTGASPWNVLPLDDTQAMVSNQSANNLVSVKWSK
jgi:hypothetical protein